MINVGAAAAVVVNVKSPPLEVPPAFTPTTRKWYVVLAVRLLTTVLTDVLLLPVTGLCAAVAVEPYEIVVPY
jgi:hypothetical protein